MCAGVPPPNSIAVPLYTVESFLRVEVDESNKRANVSGTGPAHTGERIPRRQVIQQQQCTAADFSI